jgi:hypothetical protein
VIYLYTLTGTSFVNNHAAAKLATAAAAADTALK